MDRQKLRFYPVHSRGVSGVKLKVSTLVLKVVLTLFLTQASLVSAMLGLMSITASSIDLKIWAGVFIVSCIVFITGIFYCWRNTFVSKITFASVIYAVALYFAINYLETGAPTINISTSKMAKPLASQNTYATLGRVVSPCPRC